MVEIQTPCYPSLRGLSAKPPGFNRVLQDGINQAKNIEEISLTELLLVAKESAEMSDLIETAWGYTSKEKLKQFNDLSRKILSEFKTVSVESVCKCYYVNDSIMVSLTETDNFGHIHKVDIRIPENYPRKPPVLESIDLPDESVKQISCCDNICELYKVFCRTISEMEPFWRIYDGFRDGAWVIDPEQPKKRDTHLRVVIEKNTSLLITINPISPDSCPEMKFLGPDKEVVPLRNRLQEKLKQYGWDPSITLGGNLLKLLDMDEFPTPSDFNNHGGVVGDGDDNKLIVDSHECSICFSLRSSDDMLPTKICNNEECTAMFHVTCLAQWFQSVPTYEPSFKLMSGECPQCSERVICPI